MEDDEHYYIATELVEGGELFDMLMEQGSFAEWDAASVIGQVLQALNYMHQRGMAHRDLKPENILMESKDRN